MVTYDPILVGPCKAKLKYGENPHQKGEVDIPKGIEVYFKNPGHINWQDFSRAWANAYDTSKALGGRPVANSYKHTSIAGAGYALELNAVEKEIFTRGKKLQEFLDGNKLSGQATAYLRATWPDRESSFGEIVGLSHTLDYSTAVAMDYKLVDGIICPGFENDAVDLIISRSRGEIPIVVVTKDFKFPKRVKRETTLGLKLTQDRDNIMYDFNLFKNRDNAKLGKIYGEVLTENKRIVGNQMKDLVLTVQSVKYSESNNVGFGYRGCTLNCAGGQKRVLSAKIAKEKWVEFMMLQHPDVLDFEPESKGFVASHHERMSYIRNIPLANRCKFAQGFDAVGDSDAFFPFPDALEELIEGGAKVVTMPGGSKKDADSIAVANKHNITLIATRIRQKDSENWEEDLMARRFTHS